MNDAFLTAIRDWWGFAAFVVAGVIGWALGQQRQQYQISDLNGEIKRLAARVEALETQGRAEAVTLSQINTTLATVQALLGGLREDMHEVKGELRGKVNK